MVIREYRGYREEEILPLYEQVGWTSYTARLAMLENAFRHSLKVLAAYEGEMLVGLVRVVGDGIRSCISRIFWYCPPASGKASAPRCCGGFWKTTDTFTRKS